VFTDDFLQVSTVQFCNSLRIINGYTQERVNFWHQGFIQDFASAGCWMKPGSLGDFHPVRSRGKAPVGNPGETEAYLLMNV